MFLAEGAVTDLYGFWLGIIVVISAVVLFIGSPILLLSTNIGARKGFLIGGSGFFGLLMLLSLLWWTSSTPLNVPRGRLATWKIAAQVSAFELINQDQLPEEVQDIAFNGREIPKEDPEFANVEATIDERLVIKAAEGGEEPTPEENEFAEFQTTDDFLVTSLYEFGGSNPDPFKFQFRHKPLYAVALYCPAASVDVPRGGSTPEPECAEGETVKALVLLRDLGSLRQPPMLTFFISSLAFAFLLLLLYWLEKDERRAEAESKPEPEPSEPEPKKEEVSA